VIPTYRPKDRQTTAAGLVEAQALSYRSRSSSRHSDNSRCKRRTGDALSPGQCLELGLLDAVAVDLVYVTTNRAQGRTVDTAHVLVDDTLTRESLYVDPRPREHMPTCRPNSSST
jgi:hypothetical protein